MIIYAFCVNKSEKGKMLKAKCLERLREAQTEKMVQGELRSDKMSLSSYKQWRPRCNIYKVDEAKGFIPYKKWSLDLYFLPKCAQLTPKSEIKSAFP